MRGRVLFWLTALAFLAGFVYSGGRWLLFTHLYPLSYKSLIFAYAEANGVDPYLVAAIIRTESGFRPDATSSQGARGLMQIMPETGRWAAARLGIEFTPDDLYDPEYNIRLGTWYLAELLREFAGDPVLALAAYNGGRANVWRWLEERQWTGEARTLDQIPFAETRRYVARVLRDHQRYLWLYGEARTGEAGG